MKTLQQRKSQITIKVITKHDIINYQVQ